MKQFSFVLGAVAAMLSSVYASEWMTDLPAAGQKAIAEGKAVLVDFTGSDWCGWCIRLRKQVLDTPEFESFSADKFVLVEVDVPQRRDFPAELRKTNEALCHTYKVKGFPTVLVMTPDGTVVGGFGGGQANFDAVSESLKKGAAAAKQYAVAAQLPDGPEKALALMEIYKGIPADVRENACGLRDRIAAMDTTDACGLQRAQKAERQRQEFRESLQKLSELPDMLAAINAFLESGELMEENKADMLHVKAQVMLVMAETEADIAAVREVVSEALAADPATTPELRAQAEAAFSNPQNLLKRAKAMRERAK